MSGNPANIDDDDDDDFENFLKEECGLRSTTVISNQPVNIESILQSFDVTRRILYNSDIRLLIIGLLRKMNIQNYMN